MRDHHQHAFVLIQEILQPVNRIQIQVIGGLVEQQRLGMSKQGLRQQHADFLSARQFGHLPLMECVGNIEALQQDGRVTFGGVPVFFADDAFEFAEPHAVGVGQFRLGINLFALFQRCPEPLVAHNDGVDDTVRVEGELILAENAELAGTHHSSLLRVQFTSQKLHESGLAGAVGTSQAVALSGTKAGGNFVKQNFGAVAHGHIAD